MRSVNQSKLILPIFIVAIISFGIIGSIFNNNVTNNLTKDPFCSIEDNLYKVINSHAIEWEAYFFTSPQANANRFLYSSTEDGQKITVIKLDNPHAFFVVTDYDYPHSYIGAKG